MKNVLKKNKGLIYYLKHKKEFIIINILTLLDCYMKRINGIRFFKKLKNILRLWKTKSIISKINFRPKIRNHY